MNDKEYEIQKLELEKQKLEAQMEFLKDASDVNLIKAKICGLL